MTSVCGTAQHDLDSGTTDLPHLSCPLYGGRGEGF